MKKSGDLRNALEKAQPRFFMMRGGDYQKLRLIEVLVDSIVIEMPVDAPMRRSVVGIIPTVDGSGVYEVDGEVDAEPAPGQPEGTIRLMLDPSKVRKVDRRGYPRVSFTPPIDAEIEMPGAGTMKASIINMSAGGLRVETSGELPPEKFLTFRFEIPVDDEIHEMALEGRIVYEIPHEGYRSYGVKFGRTQEDETLPEGDGYVDEADRTVDLMNLVNRLLIRE